ncbi:anti-sigma factor [Pedococcus sp. KACC 23699]|uniref:Anti-sigma factor n=1 Tax=Pedococcus sp. KACC 23699 TaxID=3149228 RepID=A0AAU7JQ37_9MICO
MSHPDEETLAGLAFGDPDVPAPDVDHVSTCPSCSATVAELRRVVAVVAASPTQLDLTSPPDGLLDRIEAQIDDDQQEAGRSVLHPAEGPRVAPAPHNSIEVAARRRWMPAAWAGGAAAAGIAIGLLAGYAVWNEPAAPAAVEVANTRLDTLDTRQWQGTATLVRDHGHESLTVNTQRLDPGSGYLEVWLINRDGKRMVSLGVLRADGRSSFPVTQQLIDEGYVVVDISKEAFDDKPAHSGDSLLRGTLAG